MSIDSDASSAFDAVSDVTGLFARLFRKLVVSLECGQLTIITPSKARYVHKGRQAGPSASLTIRRWRAVRRLVLNGDLGFAEAYIDGDWTSPDLAAVLELAAQNLTQLDRNASGVAPLRFLNRLRHLAHSNTRAGSKRNISFHYDLGNAFYQRWLDQSMSYSSAIYSDADQSIEAAQLAKMDRIVELLDISGDERVLEIGCGWGALSQQLAAVGASVRGITLSREQLAYAEQRIQSSRLDQNVTLELIDYRDVDGEFDRIVSVEMMEAVGEPYWPVYFETLRTRLKTSGTAVLQVITIDETRYDKYRSSADFIQRYVFPGGMLPTRSIIATQAAAAGLQLVSSEHFGNSYALTLAEWRRNFLRSWSDIATMGYPEEFRRLWEFYLCYCEAGFRTGAIDVGIYVLKHAGDDLNERASA